MLARTDMSTDQIYIVAIESSGNKTEIDYWCKVFEWLSLHISEKLGFTRLLISFVDRLLNFSIVILESSQEDSALMCDSSFCICLECLS